MTGTSFARYVPSTSFVQYVTDTSFLRSSTTALTIEASNNIYPMFISDSLLLSSDQLYGQLDSFRTSQSTSLADPSINVNLIGIFEHNSTFGTW